MRPPSASELLDAWERGLAAPPFERALTLLAAACPETPVEDLVRESVGRRDSRLLTLREQVFGPRLVSLVDCPACRERLETAFDVAEIRVEEKGGGQAQALTLAHSGFELAIRLPNSQDLAALAATEGAVDPRRLLFARCLVAARGPEGEEVDPRSLPESAIQAVAERMAEADPQGDVQIALSCPACGHAWPAAFDILAFIWIEIDAWARGLLREIHALASAYCWREADILALSPWRRRSYLELIGG